MSQRCCAEPDKFVVVLLTCTAPIEGAEGPAVIAGADGHDDEFQLVTTPVGADEDPAGASVSGKE
ncbi:hypothetical protein OU415_26585 [Saccharopolyspora sp. WRP15-2]|uniref:Uncharacterized protein n=1 Tax=Saccharopolyspora oryzae TaxID=2997343 RepID=A0ABT4V4Y9_9PSEU|nr:hypothetical protein [Saccharopolyspora oryzae]MDA3629029.1 hypothetical protein [Saccharopolyspora oryzae]